MNFNTILLCLLIIATYLNLYLTFKRIKRQKEKTKLPISSKEWREKVEDEKFKSWMSNRERLKDKKKNQWKILVSSIIIDLVTWIRIASERIYIHIVNVEDKTTTIENIFESTYLSLWNLTRSSSKTKSILNTKLISK